MRSLQLTLVEGRRDGQPKKQERNDTLHFVYVKLIKENLVMTQDTT